MITLSAEAGKGGKRVIQDNTSIGPEGRRETTSVDAVRRQVSSCHADCRAARAAGSRRRQQMRQRRPCRLPAPFFIHNVVSQLLIMKFWLLISDDGLRGSTLRRPSFFCQRCGRGTAAVTPPPSRPESLCRRRAARSRRYRPPRCAPPRQARRSPRQTPCRARRAAAVRPPCGMS